MSKKLFLDRFEEYGKNLWYDTETNKRLLTETSEILSDIRNKLIEIRDKILDEIYQNAFTCDTRYAYECQVVELEDIVKIINKYLGDEEHETI